MKKFIAVMTAAAMLTSLSACGASASTASSAASSEAASSVAASSEAASEAASSEAAGESVELIVFAAASLTETLNAIAQDYSAENPGVTFRFNFDSSGTLKTQIQEGADCDLFLSAGQKQMNQLDKDADPEVNTEGLDYVRLPGQETWVVSMRPDDLLAQKTQITKEDLLNKPLILPERTNIQSELAHWFGKDYEHLNVAFVSNLHTNAAIMAKHGLGYPITVRGTMSFWKEDALVHRELFPKLSMPTVIAWRRNIPYSQAVLKFIEEINAFQA